MHVRVDLRDAALMGLLHAQTCTACGLGREHSTAAHSQHAKAWYCAEQQKQCVTLTLFQVPRPGVLYSSVLFTYSSQGVQAWTLGGSARDRCGPRTSFRSRLMVSSFCPCLSSSATVLAASSRVRSAVCANTSKSLKNSKL